MTRPDHRLVAPEMQAASACTPERLRERAATRAPWLAALAERVGAAQHAGTGDPTTAAYNLALRRAPDDIEIAERLMRHRTLTAAIAADLVWHWEANDAAALARSRSRR